MLIGFYAWFDGGDVGQSGSDKLSDLKVILLTRNLLLKVILLSQQLDRVIIKSTEKSLHFLPRYPFK